MANLKQENEQLHENIRFVYKELNRRADRSLQVGTQMAMGWAEAYHDAAVLIAAAFVIAGVPLEEKEVENVR